MKSRIITLLLLAAISSSAITSCGTVENIGTSSAPDIGLESSIIDESLEQASETTTLTDVSSTTTSNTSSGSESTTDKTSQTQTTTVTGGYVAGAENKTGSSSSSSSSSAAQQNATAAPATEAPTAAPTTAAVSGSFSHDDMFFLYGGSQATVLADASGIVSALGTPSDVREADSCLNNGLPQKIYSFSGVDIYAYVDGDREIINLIELTSSAYSTPKGLSVGMSESDITKIYGTGYEKYGNDYCYYDSSDTYLYITTSGGTIVSIEYCADV